ncbi:MAG: murein L,D-transpeptidase family protein [Pyrinomonadaceae bacterium]
MHTKQLVAVTVLILSTTTVAIQNTNPDSRSTFIARPSRLKLPLKNQHIVVHKRERRLELFAAETLIGTYKIGLGFNPGPDKKQEGDGATPEGDFYIFTKNDKSAYYLSLGISYPNVEDAERGVRDGLISKAESKAIANAIEQKKMPPQYTKLGGLIYIHGNGAASDWTLGCVALENGDMRELFDAVSVRTPVRILP